MVWRLGATLRSIGALVGLGQNYTFITEYITVNNCYNIYIYIYNNNNNSYNNCYNNLQK